MSSWVKGGVRRPPLKHSGGSAVSPIRPLRTAPYPLREERKDDHQISESCENLEERLKYSNTTEFERSPLQSTAVSSDEYVASEQHSAVYERIYQRLQGDGSRTRADCVVLSVNNQNLDYPKSIGQCLQERGLTVEMLYLQADSGLTQALQDVRSDGSPLCILVEQTNVTLSSCTVIIFSPSLKIHRNMPKEQALDFVMVEFGQLTGSQRTPDPTETAARAAELTEDYMERTKLERHSVPSATRHLLFLLSEGLPLYPEELSTLAQFIHNRQDHLQASPSDADAENPPVINSLPAGLGKPPPLLPAPAGPKAPPSGPRGASAGHHMPSQDTYPKSKPPPLLSMQNLKPPSRGPMPSYGSSQAPLLPKPQPLLALPSQLGPPSPWSPLLDLPPRGFGSSRGLLPHHPLHGPPQNGPRGPRAPPPSLRSLHLGAPTGSGARPLRRLLP